MRLFVPAQSDIALGFVLFDSSVGTEWMDEYDTDVNDHKFYQVRTKHYRVSVIRVLMLFPYAQKWSKHMICR